MNCVAGLPPDWSRTSRQACCIVWTTGKGRGGIKHLHFTAATIVREFGSIWRHYRFSFWTSPPRICLTRYNAETAAHNFSNECGTARHPVKNVALVILPDYLDGEEDCERKATVLAWAFARKLGGIGSGGKLLLRDKTSWSLTETQVRDMVTEILCDAKLLTSRYSPLRKSRANGATFCGKLHCRRRHHGCRIDPA